MKVPEIKTEKPVKPTEAPVMPTIKPILAAPHNVGKSDKGIVKSTFLVCLTVIAVVGMVHEKPSNASLPAPAPVIEKSHITHIHHAKEKVKHRHKKHLTKAMDSYNQIEEIESRVTKLEGRMDNAGI